MAAKLNEELRQVLKQHGGGPVEVFDPDTNKVYLLIDREQYDRLKPLFQDDPLTDQEQRHLLKRAGQRAGWDDAEMNAYDHYDEHRSQQP